MFNKRIFLVFLLLLLVSPVFASISTGSSGLKLDANVLAPLTNAFKIGRLILVFLIVADIIVTGIKYASSSGDRKSEYLKTGIIVAVVLAIIYFIALSVPNLLGISDVTFSDTAVITLPNIEGLNGI